ncbi:MAG: carboxypeptidase regulatory-like domain-containing protein, partial [Myxococcales bacterium]
PDGGKRAGKTGADGKLHLDGVAKGSCQLSLPDVKAAASPAAAAGRIAYADGVAIPTGTPAVVETPAAVHRARLSGIHFETAKTFLLPTAMNGIRQLRSLYDSFGADLSVLCSGHTDTVGAADYNRGLSEERADSVARFLQDDVEGWMKWYGGQPHSDKWGMREDQFMLATVKDPSGAPYYQDRVDGQGGTNTRNAIKHFQSDNGVSATGTADGDTRRALVKAYMSLEGTTLPAAAKLSSHGCGLTHLEVPTGPNTAEERNRRVEIYLFEGEVAPAPQTPCPAGGCAEYPQWLAAKGLDVDLDAPPGQAAITVTDASGKPIAGADVHLGGPMSFDAKSGADGVAAFDAVVPGAYQAVAVKDGFDAADAAVTVEAGAKAAVSLKLPAMLIALKVVVEDTLSPPNPVPGATVTIDRPGAPQLVSAADGVVRFEGLAPGPVTVTIVSRGVKKQVNVVLGGAGGGS